MKEKQAKAFRIACAAAVAALLIAAGAMALARGQGAPIVALGEEKPGELYFWRAEAGAENARVQRFDGALAAELVRQINLQSAAETERFAPPDVSVAYGIRIPLSSGAFEAVYCDGQWAASTGRSWASKLNLARVWEQAGMPEQEPRPVSEFPNIRALAEAGGRWNAAYLTPAAHEAPESEEITLSMEGLDGETGVARLKLSNHGRFTHSVSMKNFALEVLADGEWYLVPPVCGREPRVEDAGYDVTVHLPVTLRLDLSAYLPLSAGEYRVTNKAENIYSVTPAVTVAARFTVE